MGQSIRASTLLVGDYLTVNRRTVKVVRIDVFDDDQGLITVTFDNGEQQIFFPGDKLSVLAHPSEDD